MDTFLTAEVTQQGGVWNELLLDSEYPYTPCHHPPLPACVGRYMRARVSCVGHPKELICRGIHFDFPQHGSIRKGLTTGQKTEVRKSTVDYL